MATIDFIPFATDGGANVISQADYIASLFHGPGFSAGIAKSDELNKVWRQSAFIAAVIANFVSQQLTVDVLDDGNLANLIANFTAAVIKASRSVQAPVVVAFSATPTFDASLGSAFEITLTGNVTSSSIINTTPGQILTFCLTEDGTGGRTFAWPPGMSAGAGAPDPTANSINLQRFYVKSDSTIHPLTGMTVS